MYPAGGEYFLLGFLIWNLVLSYFIFSQKKFLNKLFPNNREEDIRGKFNDVLEALGESRKEKLSVNKNIRELIRANLGNVSKMVLLRYNPYQDTGGNVSFSIALLNGKGSGIILTSLHTRAGTRIYAKEVVEGRSELQLSKEEQEVMSKALSADE